MSLPLNVMRLRAALHLLSLAGADISNIVRAHAQSLGLQADVCQPLSRESAAALDAVVALAARSNEPANAACTPAPLSYEGIESGADWFGDSVFGGDFCDFAFPALQHREGALGGGQMTFQVRVFFACGFFAVPRSLLCEWFSSVLLCIHAAAAACSSLKLFRAPSTARVA